MDTEPSEATGTERAVTGESNATASGTNGVTTSGTNGPTAAPETAPVAATASAKGGASTQPASEEPRQSSPARRDGTTTEPMEETGAGDAAVTSPAPANGDTAETSPTSTPATGDTSAETAPAAGNGTETAHSPAAAPAPAAGDAAASDADAGEEEDEEGEEEEDMAEDRLSQLSYSTSCDESDDGEFDEAALSAALADMKKKAEDIIQKPKPQHTWSLVKELHKRQLGGRPSVVQQDKFRLHMYSSLHAVERLELMDKLCFHEGCVNCLHFNASGELLASGSDDLKVVVWDWQRQRKAYYYNSGHKSNIFEAKFLPLRGDTHIVSTSRDGQVRLAEVSPAGECRSIRRLAQHRGSGRKLALLPHSPHTLLSCGEDALVFSIDIRQRQPDRLTECLDGNRKIAPNSIASHPYDDNVFLLACTDKHVRIYDRRMIGTERQAFRRFCPHRLLDDGRGRYSVTCAVFNHDGTEIVASYNDEDCYLFDASHSDGADALHQYSGHRNSATIKGVNFYGPTSQYVVSGSDCGNIFFWDKDTEAIVQCMPGDEKGVVNCLEPHPHMPVLATSGLDDDVKLWIASRDQPPDLSALRETVERNLQERVEDTPSADSLGGSLMWTLMQQVFGAQRRRHQLFSDELDLQSSDESGADEEDAPGDCRPT